MLSYVEGKNVILEALRPVGMTPTYVPFACSTSLEFSYDTELVEKATVNMGGIRAYAPGFGEWGITLNSITSIAPNNNVYTVFDTLLETLRKQGISIRLRYEDNNGNLQVITGKVFIPRTSITSPEDSLSDDTIEMKGSGPFQLTTTIINPGTVNAEVMKLEFTSITGGENAVTFSQLIGKTLAQILLFTRSGVEMQVITVGTPNDRQVKFVPATGVFSLPYQLDPQEDILCLYK